MYGCCVWLRRMYVIGPYCSWVGPDLKTSSLDFFADVRVFWLRSIYVQWLVGAVFGLVVTCTMSSLAFFDHARVLFFWSYTVADVSVLPVLGFVPTREAQCSCSA